MGCNCSRENGIQLNGEWFDGMGDSSCVDEEIIKNTDAGNNGNLTKTEYAPEVLDEEQKRLIRQTWAVLSPNLTSIGKQVFLRIFEFRPSAKRLFPFREVWGDQLIRHPLFLAHSSRFVHAIGCVVARLDNLQGQCRVPLVQLGRRHVTIEGFLPDYFDVFLRAITSVWKQELKEQYTVEVGIAWELLLHFIVNKLKDGYDAERKSRFL